MSTLISRLVADSEALFGPLSIAAQARIYALRLLVLVAAFAITFGFEAVVWVGYEIVLAANRSVTLAPVDLSAIAGSFDWRVLPFALCAAVVASSLALIYAHYHFYPYRFDVFRVKAMYLFALVQGGYAVAVYLGTAAAVLRPDFGAHLLGAVGAGFSTWTLYLATGTPQAPELDYRWGTAGSRERSSEGQRALEQVSLILGGFCFRAAEDQIRDGAHEAIRLLVDNYTKLPLPRLAEIVSNYIDTEPTIGDGERTEIKRRVELLLNDIDNAGVTHYAAMGRAVIRVRGTSMLLAVLEDHGVRRP